MPTIGNNCHKPGEELYGQPAMYDDIYILPVTIPELTPAQRRNMSDRANLTINNLPPTKFYGTSRLVTSRIQLLDTPHQLRSRIVRYSPSPSPIGPGYGTWVGPKRQGQHIVKPGPAAYMQIDPNNLTDYLNSGMGGGY